MSERVTAVEGGRWSESVSAAKGTFKKLFTLGRKSDNRRKRGDRSVKRVLSVVHAYEGMMLWVL